MDKTVFESFEDYLEEANYPQGKKKIMQAAVDLISTRSYHGTSTLHIAERAGLSQATLFKYFKTKANAFASPCTACFIRASGVAAVSASV